MKKIIVSLALAGMAGIASAQAVTNLVPNGDFSNPGPSADWVEVQGGGFAFSYPTTGGNPDAYGVIDGTAGTSFAIWVNGNSTPLSISSLGLSAGVTYTFLVDMKVLSSNPGTNLGGFKVDFFNGGTMVGSTGDMRPSPAGHNIANWETYGYSVAIPPTADGVKLVPLWGPSSSVGYDNFRVVVPATSPLVASITSPANLATVGTGFTINANATVLPGSVTNVYFYDGNTLLGNADTSPYSFAVTGASVGAHALKVVAKADTGGSVTSSVVNVTVATSTTLYVDPTKGWVGYMNVFEIPQIGGAYDFGGSWGIADLCAVWSGSNLTLSPNSVNDPSGYWYTPSGAPGAVANKSMDASMYVEPVGSLPGLTVTFTGACLTNSLVSASNTNALGNGWTCVAFVKDYAPDFSSVNVATTQLTNGTVFSVSLATANDPARHVQYGFETIGPCVWPTDPALPGFGNVKVGPLASTPNAVSITPRVNGSTFSLSFPTQTGFAYTVLYKTNLTSTVWSTMAVTNGTGATAVVTGSKSVGQMFYRLSIQ